MSTTSFIEILEKLPFNRRQEVFNFLQFIYQKSQEEEGDSELTKAEISELQKRRKAYLLNPLTGVKLEDAKQKLLSKYGL